MPYIIAILLFISADAASGAECVDEDFNILSNRLFAMRPIEVNSLTPLFLSDAEGEVTIDHTPDDQQIGVIRMFETHGFDLKTFFPFRELVVRSEKPTKENHRLVKFFVPQHGFALWPVRNFVAVVCSKSGSVVAWGLARARVSYGPAFGFLSASFLLIV